MNKLKLTKTAVDNIALPENGDAWVWDKELEGFGVRVQASGRKTYVVRYRVRDEKRTQRKQTIGRCSDMPPEKARELARKVFAQVAEGQDPLKTRRQIENDPTVTQLKERYMKEHAEPFKKPRSAELDEKNWRLHILPSLGSKKVRSVTKADILGLHGSLSLKPATANQCLALLSKAFNLAEDWEYRDRHTNPCHKVKKYVIKERELILSQDEIYRLNATMADLVASSAITKEMALLVRLLMLTGCRLREIMHARMDWVDLDRSLLLLPDSKVGQRKIPLSPAAVELIESMPADQEWLIPGKVKGEPLITPYKAWSRIKKKAGLPKELRMHDLRHTVGSLGHMSGLSQKQIQLLLGHKNIATTARYIHGAAGETAIIAEKMGNVIVAAFGSKAA